MAWAYGRRCVSELTGSQALMQRADAVLRTHLGAIYCHLEDPKVQEVMINRPDSIWVESAGAYRQLDLRISSDALVSAIIVLCNINNKGTTLLVDCRLPGLRIAATLPPVSAAGPSMSIRRHSARSFTLDDYLQSGALDPVVNLATGEPPARPEDVDIAQGREGLAAFLQWMVQSRANFIVSGSTSSGKTALLNALGQFIQDNDRIITIDDTIELQLSLANRVAFEANASGGVSIRDLVRHTLRYRPNRIWVGEIRGPEAFDMQDAYNTGHPGGAVSMHSDSCHSCPFRLENMIRMTPEASNWPLADLRRQIASTFRYVLHASNTAGHRGPVELMELSDAHEAGYQTRTLFKKQFTYN